ncbi:MAG: HesB/IscA family protein [Bacteroidota bacterium]
MNMINVTESAKTQAMKLMEEDGKQGYFIRVGVQGGGCSGLMYQLDLDNQEKEDDKSFEDNGVKIVVDKKSFLYLIGTTLDFSGGLNGKGFVFKNPNADRTCGCGESFSV